MVIFGVLVAIEAMKRSAAIGQTDAGIAFAIVPLSGIAFFAVVFALAVGSTRRPETHKRLMLLASISLLDAAVARWFLTFLAPPGPLGPPPVPVTIAPALAAYLLLVIAVVHDWRRTGRPHPVYVYGGIAMVAVKAPELADQPHAGLARICRRHTGAGAVTIASTVSSRRTPGPDTAVARAEAVRVARPLFNNECGGYGSGVRRGDIDGRAATDDQHLHVNPPSTTSVMPVMYFASSDARNSAALATSKASPMCPIGTWASRTRHISATSPLA